MHINFLFLDCYWIHWKHAYSCLPHPRRHVLREILSRASSSIRCSYEESSSYRHLFLNLTVSHVLCIRCLILPWGLLDQTVRTGLCRCIQVSVFKLDSIKKINQILVVKLILHLYHAPTEFVLLKSCSYQRYFIYTLMKPQSKNIIKFCQAWHTILLALIVHIANKFIKDYEELSNIMYTIYNINLAEILCS